MKILLTTHQFFPQFGAGTEVLTLAVARELIKRGYSVHVLTGHPSNALLADADRYDEYDINDIHVYRFHHAYTPMGGQSSLIEIGYNNHLAAAYFECILESFMPNLVHFFHLNRLGTGLIEYAVKAGVPCFMTPTDFWAICPTGQLLLGDNGLCDGPSAHAGNCLKHFVETTQSNIIAKFGKALPDAWADSLVQLTSNGKLPNYPKRIEVAALATRLPINVSRLNKLSGIIAPTDFMREMLVKYGVNPDLVSKSAFGVEVPETHQRAVRSYDHHSLRVAYIGTLAPHKGCHVLVNALKALDGLPITLDIYGSPDDFPMYFKSLKTMVGLSKSINFCGTFPNGEIANIFETIDVLVIPSIWYENTPLVLYSAQSAGCPVIVSDQAGLSEVVRDNVDGLVFETGNASVLASTLLRLIKDTGLLRRLAGNVPLPKSTKIYVDELERNWFKKN